MAISEDTFFLNSTFEGTLQQQIQSLVAEGILSGRFRSGEKLPSSRRLAKHLGISRITVTLAYTELLADDYVIAKGRSGYYVSDTAPQPRMKHSKAKSAETVDWARLIGTRFTRPRNWKSPKIGSATAIPSFTGKPIRRFLIMQIGGYVRCRRSGFGILMR